MDFGIPSKPNSVPVFCQGSGLNHQTHQKKQTKNQTNLSGTAAKTEWQLLTIYGIGFLLKIIT